KPESVTLPGFPWRSEIRYAEISHMGKMIGCRCRVNDRPEARVLVVGFGPTRACAQRCVRSPRLPVSPHQHLVGYEPRQSRRPRRDTPHVLPPAGAQCVVTGTSVVPGKRELERKPADHLRWS